MQWLKNLFSNYKPVTEPAIEDEQSSDEAVDDFMDELMAAAQPRPHHYAFAQHAIPGIAHSDPEWFFDSFPQNPTVNISELWQRVCEAEQQEHTELTADDFDLTAIMLDDKRALLFTLPEPLAPIESYALVVIEDNTGEAVKSRCITFEKADDDDMCFVCEVTEDSSHLNLGEISITMLQEDKSYFAIAHQRVFA